jgi:hypothetical protein
MMLPGRPYPRDSPWSKRERLVARHARSSMELQAENEILLDVHEGGVDPDLTA